MTTTAVCKRLGRRCITCAVDRGCVTIGQHRVDEVVVPARSQDVTFWFMLDNGYFE
jgi:hypothetical protein